MSDTELRHIYHAAAANENGAGNYMYPTVEVENLALEFDVDMDLNRDMDDPDRLQRAVGIAYSPAAGGADDLVYTTKIEGSTVSAADVVSEEEFVQRVHEVARDWRLMIFGE